MVIVISGAAGFLGSELIKYFLSKERKVIGLVRESSLLERLKSVQTDRNLTLLNFSEINHIPIKDGFFGLINTVTRYDLSELSDEEILESNFTLPNQLFFFAEKHQAKFFINTGTALPSTLNRYSLSKSFFSKWAAYKTNELLFCDLLIQSFYGNDPIPNGFINRTAQSLLKNTTQLSFTSGVQKRDLIHVDDVVDVIERIIDNIDDLKNGYLSFDVGTGQAATIKDVIEKMKRGANSSTNLGFGDIPMRKEEPNNLVADISFISERLGKRSFISIEDGIKSIMEYYKDGL